MKEKYQYFFVQIKSLENHWQQFKKDIKGTFEGLAVFGENKANNIFQKAKITRQSVIYWVLINKQAVLKKVLFVKLLSKEWHEIAKKTEIKAVESIDRIKDKNIKVWKKSWTALHDLRCKVTFIGLGAFLSVALTSFANEGVNPFDPIFNASSGSTNASDYIGTDSSVHPLQQQAVKDYTLMALISSKTGDIAMVRAKNGEEFFVKMNDILGNADGKITSINKRGIEVTEKDKVVSLLVRNRGVNNDKN